MPHQEPPADDDQHDAPHSRHADPARTSDGDLPVSVVLRPLATGLPLGLLAFSAGMLLLAGDALGWVPAAEQPTTGLLIASYVAPLELLGAVFALLARDAPGGTTLGLFTTSWLALGLSLLRADPGSLSAASGLFQVGFAVIIAGVAVVAVPAKPLFSVLLALSAVRSALEGVHQLTGTTAVLVPEGVVALAVVVVGVYTGLALLVEDSWPRPVLPVFRRAAAARALSGSVAGPGPGLAGEPGVREQL